MKDIVAVVFGFGMALNALLFVPQALAIWRTKQSKGVSLLTFGGFNILQLLTETQEHIITLLVA